LALLRIVSDRQFNEISREILPGPEPDISPLAQYYLEQIRKNGGIPDAAYKGNIEEANRSHN
jgi:hypothetical protein